MTISEQIGGAGDSGTAAAQTVGRWDEPDPQSGWISLDLPPGIITPVPGGVTDSHITVVFLGKDVDDDAFALACERAQAAAAAVPGPLTGMVGGIGTFPPSEGSDGKVPAWAGVILPGAEKLRAALEDLSASEHPDWSPHVTIAYVQPGEPLPPPALSMQVTFSHLSVHRGDDEVVRYPIGGDPGQAGPETISGQATTLAAAETTTLSVEVSGPPEQVARFAQLCKTIQALCAVGASRTVQIDVDGDGNASLHFTFTPADGADSVEVASFDSDPVRIPGIGG